MSVRNRGDIRKVKYEENTFGFSYGIKWKKERR